MQRLLSFGLALCVIVGGRASALPLWELEGSGNRVHILGSVHFLRAQDYPLPDRIMDVYADADVVVFELNLSTMDAIETQALMRRLAIDPRGNDLEDYLGSREYRTAATLAGDLDIDLAALRPYEPWFAALQITQLRLAQLGFDGTYGIETQFTLRAVGDGKRIEGLESLEDQFSSLDSLPAPAQREFLMQTLEDAADIEGGLDRIITAWRAGDNATLNDELMMGLEGQPELYDRILVRRNRNWTRQIIGFADSGENYLVVVGTLHLVGDDSVIRMLADAGYPARQLR